MITEKQLWAIYKKEHKKWLASRPESGHNYDLEAWLEEKPTKPDELPS